MELTHKQEKGATIILVPGPELDHTVCNEFQRRVGHLLEDGGTKVVLNLSEVEFMDSCGIGTLITLRNKLMKDKGGIVLCELSDRVKKILDITALHKVFDIFESEEEAVAGFGGQEE